MMNWFKKLLIEKNYITKRRRKNLDADTNEKVDEIVEKMKKEIDLKNKKIRNLLIDIMLIENDTL